MALLDQHLRNFGVSVRLICKGIHYKRDIRSCDTKVQWYRVTGPPRMSAVMGSDENAATEIDLGRVVNALSALVWTTQGDGRGDFVNRYWCEYTGLGPA